MPDDDADNPLAIEIKQEKAAAYFAVCKKMLASIEALQAFDRDLPLWDVTLQQKAQVRTRTLPVEGTNERDTIAISV